MVGTGITRSEPDRLQGPQLVVDDIEAAHEELAGRGVDVSPVQHFAEDGLAEGKGGPWNSWPVLQRPGRQRLGDPGATRTRGQERETVRLAPARRDLAS